jgi:phospholipase C
VRVPAILVSPYAADPVFKQQLDHTSLLKYLIDKWQLGPLGERTARAYTFASALHGPPRPDTPRFISPVPSGLMPVPAPPRQPLNDHQSALVALSHALESMAEEDPNIVAARSRQVLSGPQSQIDTAVDRVEAFLSHATASLTKAV